MGTLHSGMAGPTGLISEPQQMPGGARWRCCFGALWSIPFPYPPVFPCLSVKFFPAAGVWTLSNAGRLKWGCLAFEQGLGSGVCLWSLDVPVWLAQVTAGKTPVCISFPWDLFLLAAGMLKQMVSQPEELEFVGWREGFCRCPAQIQFGFIPSQPQFPGSGLCSCPGLVPQGVQELQD